MSVSDCASSARIWPDVTPSIIELIALKGRYDIAFYGWYAGMDPDDSGQFTCDQRPPNGYDHSFYCSAEMDAAQRDPSIVERYRQ